MPVKMEVRSVVFRPNMAGIEKGVAVTKSRYRANYGFLPGDRERSVKSLSSLPIGLGTDINDTAARVRQLSLAFGALHDSINHLLARRARLDWSLAV
jgi:hypothetical protein